MASKYNQVGTVWLGKQTAEGDQLPHTMQFKEGFVPKAEAWYQFHSKKFKEQDLERKVKQGWISEENAEKARHTISKMPDKVIAEIIEVIKE